MWSGGPEERIEPIHPGPPTRREQGGEGGPGSDRFDCDRSRIPGRVDGHLARGGFSGKPISTGAWHSGSAAMKVLVVLTYYRPHVSGLTIYVERLARAPAARGHQGAVPTSPYERSLPPADGDG